MRLRGNKRGERRGRQTNKGKQKRMKGWEETRKEMRGEERKGKKGKRQ